MVDDFRELASRMMVFSVDAGVSWARFSRLKLA